MNILKKISLIPYYFKSPKLLALIICLPLSLYTPLTALALWYEPLPDNLSTVEENFANKQYNICGKKHERCLSNCKGYDTSQCFSNCGHNNMVCGNNISKSILNHRKKQEAANRANSGPQACLPLPPNCDRATKIGMDLLASFKQTAGIYEPASQMYCGLLVGIKINAFCAREYRTAGNTYCADLSDQQVREYERALPQTLRVIDAVKVSEARRACSWDR